MALMTEKERKKIAGSLPRNTAYESKLLEQRRKELYTTPYIPKKTTAEPKKDTAVLKKSSVFDDGYQFGDVSKATSATVADIGSALLKGIFNVGEGIADLGTYTVAGVADLFGQKEWADKQRVYAKQNTVQDTLFDTRETSKLVSNTPMKTNFFDDIQKESVAGGGTRQVAEGIGYVAGMYGAGGILGGASKSGGISQISIGKLPGTIMKSLKVPSSITKAVSAFKMPTASFLTASGSSMSQAYNEGATDGEAFVYGLMSGTVEGIVEGLGGISSLKMSALGTGATDVLKKSLVDKVKSKVGKALINAGVEFVDEGLEEVISGVINPYLKRMTYDKDAKNASADELFNEFLMGGLVAAVLGMPSVVSSMKKSSKANVSTNIEKQATSSNVENQQEVKKEEVKTPEQIVEQQKQASKDTAIKGDLTAIDARLNFLENDISRIDNPKNIDIEKIGNEIVALRAERAELLKTASVETQEEELEQLSLDLDTLEATPEESKTPVVIEKMAAKKTEQQEIIENLDKDKPIKTHYNRQFILDTKELLFVEAQTIVDSMNTKRVTEKPLEIQPETEYDETQQRIADVAAAFKKQVVFLKNADFGGMVPLENENIIFIGDNINNDLILSNNQVDKMTYALGHEMFHSLKMSYPEIFNEFTDFIKTDVTEEQLIKFMEKYDPTDEAGLLKALQIDGKFDIEAVKADNKKYNAQNKALNYIVEEMVANEFGGMITDKKYMTDLNAKNPGLFTKIVKALKELFSVVDAPIYSSPLTQLQVTKIRKDFEFLSTALAENLETKVETKKEVVKQEEPAVDLKQEVKKEPTIAKKEVIKQEVKKQTLPKKENIVKKETVKEEDSLTKLPDFKKKFNNKAEIEKEIITLKEQFDKVGFEMLKSDMDAENFNLELIDDPAILKETKDKNKKEYDELSDLFDALDKRIVELEKEIAKPEVKKPLPKKEVVKKDDVVYQSLNTKIEEKIKESEQRLTENTKTTVMSLDSRYEFLQKNYQRYLDEKSPVKKKAILETTQKAYDNYKKDGGTKVVVGLENNKKLPSKEPTQYATAAPYYKTKITNDNFDVIKDKVHRDFNKKALEFASELGIEIANVSINKGGYTFQEGENAGKQVEELSYTYELKNATPQQADYFASLLGDLGYEGQEAVIAYNYVNDNDPSANIVEFAIKVNNTEGISKILKQNGITDYTIDVSNGIIKILDFGVENQDATVDKIDNIIRELGGKYEKITRQKANSRYLDSKTRQKAYREWLQTNRTSKQNGNLRSYIEQAQKKIGEVKYLPNKMVKDNKGKALTKQQQEFFKDSKVKDENGNLLQVFHTTTDRKNNPFYEFNPIGTPNYRFDDVVVNFYTDNEVMSESYAGSDAPINITGYNLKTIEGIKNYLKQTDTGTLLKNKEGYIYKPSIIEKTIQQIPQIGSFLDSLSAHEKRVLTEIVKRATLNKSNVSDSVYRFMLGTMSDAEQKELGINVPIPKEHYSSLHTNKVLGQKLKKFYDTVKNVSFNREMMFNVLKRYGFNTELIFNNEEKLSEYFEEASKLSSIEKYQKYKYSGYLNLKNPFVVDGKNKNWNKIQQGVDEQAKEYIQQLSKDEKEILIKAARDSNSRFGGNYNLELENFKTNMGLDLYAELRDRTKEYIGDYDLYDFALSEFSEDSLQKEATTNDIVKEVLKNNTKNYDGVIIKNIIDYGSSTDSSDPGNVYISFASNQFKGIDNTNPTQSDDIRYLPSNITKDDKTTGISEFVTNTMEKASMFSDVVEQARKDPTFGEYIKTNKDDRRAKAMKLLEEKGQEEINRLLSGTAVLSDVEVSLAGILKKYYKSKGDRASGLLITKALKLSSTPTAQALQSYSELQLDGDDAIVDFQNMLDKMYEDFKDSKDPTIKIWMKEHVNKDSVKLTEAEEEYIYQMVEKANKLDKNSDEYKTRMSLVNTFIANKMPKEFWTKVKNFRRMGFLFNPKTIIRNWAGNVLMEPIYDVADMFGAKIDKSTSNKLGTSRTTDKVDKSVYKLAKKEGKQAAIQDLKYGVFTGLGNPLEVAVGQTFNPATVIGKSLNEIEKLTNFAMSYGDRGFENAHYLNTLANLMRLNNIETATESMVQLAKDVASKRTWKNNGKMVKVAGQMRQMFNMIGIKDGKLGVQNFGTKVDIGLGDIILPFIMTPANLLVATYDFSPLAAISAVKNWNTLKETIKKGGDTMTAQKNFVDSTSKAMTGTLLFIIAGALAKMGAISGGEDEDKDKRELDKILGNQPYSVKIGDMSFTYDWAQPVSNIFATMGELERQTSIKSDTQKMNFVKMVGEAFTIGGDRLVEQSFLQNVKTLIGGGYGESSLGERVIDLTADIPSSMIPTLFKQFADLLDGDIKTSYNKNSPLETMIAKTMARIPGVKGALPTKKDVLGNNLKYNTSIWTGLMTSFLLPMNIKRDVAGELGDEITDVFNHTGDKTIIPQVAVKYIDYDSDGDGKVERYDFNPSQQSQLQETMGKIVSESFGGMFVNDIYMNATYDEKAKSLTALMEYAKGKALEDLGLVPNYISGNDNLVQIKKYMDAGLDVANSIMYRGIISPMKGDKDAEGNTIEGTTQGKKAFTIINMQTSDAAKDIMLDLITDGKTHETTTSLSKLSTQQQFIDYYSLNRSDLMMMKKFSRDDYDIATSKFNIDGKQFMKAVGGLSEIKSDVDAKGNTIENSKKKKVTTYINSLPLNQIQKIYMYGMAGYSIKQWRNEMYTYISGLDIAAEEKKKMWEQLGLK